MPKLDSEQVTRWRGDLLIPLHQLEEIARFVKDQKFKVRRAQAAERTPISEWIRVQFGQGWADESSGALLRSPPDVFVATVNSRLVGFIAFDATRLGFVGPLGISAPHRGGVGAKALINRALHAMLQRGYGYAVAGDVQFAKSFIQRSFRAMPIPDSYPGTYSLEKLW